MPHGSPRIDPIRAAEQSGQPLQVCAGIYRLTQAFVRLKRLDQAETAFHDRARWKRSARPSGKGRTHRLAEWV